jgi:hypothetical protein
MMSIFLIALIAFIVAVYLFNRGSLTNGGGGSCGCNKNRDPAYIDDPQTNLDRPIQYNEWSI